MWNSRVESVGKKEEDTWRCGKLYRPNEAIKFNRGHVITAYKGARKILPIPAYVARKEDEKMRPGRAMRRGGTRCVFFSLRSCEDWLAFFLFFFTAWNSIDWTQVPDGPLFSAREDPWPLLPGNIQKMLRYTQITSRERDLFSPDLFRKQSFLKIRKTLIEAYIFYLYICDILLFKLFR